MKCSNRDAPNRSICGRHVSGAREEEGKLLKVIPARVLVSPRGEGDLTNAEAPPLAFGPVFGKGVSQEENNII